MPTTPSEIRFAADAMVQSLAKWLRLMGYDCISGEEYFGRALVERAVKEDRWVLSRNSTFDSHLPKSLLEKMHFAPVVSETLPEQVREVVTRFNLDPETALFTRCVECNTPLREVEFSTVESRLPENVAAQQTRFWQCDHCERIYWRGSHVTRSVERLRQWLALI